MSLIEQLHAAERTEREQAARLYGELLARYESPRPGDLSELRNCMRRLGRVATDLDDDRVLAAEAAAADRLQARLPAATAEHSAAHRELAAAQRLAEQKRAALEAELTAELEPLEAHERRIVGELAAINQQLRTLTVSASRWARIIGSPAT